MSLSTWHEPHNNHQKGFHISIFQGGDRVICIYLMSIPPGGEKWTPAEAGWHCSKAFFSSAYYDNIGPCMQTKHCYIDNQEVWHRRHCGDVFFGKRRCTGDGISSPAKWVTWMVRKRCNRGLFWRLAWQSLVTKARVLIAGTSIRGIPD